MIGFEGISSSSILFTVYRSDKISGGGEDIVFVRLVLENDAGGVLFVPLAAML